MIITSYVSLFLFCSCVIFIFLLFLHSTTSDLPDFTLPIVSPFFFLQKVQIKWRSLFQNFPLTRLDSTRLNSTRHSTLFRNKSTLFNQLFSTCCHLVLFFVLHIKHYYSTSYQIISHYIVSYRIIL
jgi:hypothetical protein